MKGKPSQVPALSQCGRFLPTGAWFARSPGGRDEEPSFGGLAGTSGIPSSGDRAGIPTYPATTLFAKWLGVASQLAGRAHSLGILP